MINNKGTGAGGANTTLNGSLFEERTSIENKLLENKYIKKEIDTKNKNKKGYYFEYIDNACLLCFHLTLVKLLQHNLSNNGLI